MSLLYNTYKAFNSLFDLKNIERVNDVFGLFKKKGRISVVPAPLGDLPTFPSPAELDELRLEPKMPVPKPMHLKLPPVPHMHRMHHQLKSHSAKPHMEHTIQSELNRPVFLKADLFQSVLHDVQTVRGRLDKSERMIARLEEVHDSQGRLLENWHSTLKEVHDKLLFVDGILFKKGDVHE